MAGEETLDRTLVRFVQRHERRLIVAWLAACALVLALLGVWGIGLNGAERVVDAWDSRWVRELDDLETQVRAGKYERALVGLEALESEQPVVSIKHRDDKQRERHLSLLGECLVKLDHKSRALAALEKLVAFDPRNFANHFQLAEAQRKFGDTGAARAEYEKVLAIHPTHWPTIRAMVDIPYAGGQYAPVVDVYEHYLDAWLLASVRVRCGDRVVDLMAHVDGRTHALEAPIELTAPFDGTITVETSGYSARVERLEFLEPLHAGVIEQQGSKSFAPDASWTVSGGNSLAANEFSASDASSKLTSPSLSLPNGAVRVRLELALFKRLDQGTWDQVVTSYKNRLELEKLRGARERSRVGGCDQGGTVFVD